VDLNRKNNIQKIIESGNKNLLYSALNSIVKEEPIDPKLIDWLKWKNLYVILCEIYHFKYDKDGKLWDLAKACSSYRKCGNPEVVINITNNINNTDFTAFGAVMTTRGGAYRDIRNYECASNCAQEAIEYDLESFYPYNLMGGIFFDIGEFSLGIAATCNMVVGVI
jgi:tetratricopeptide (TPR) repeat protein